MTTINHKSGTQKFDSLALGDIGLTKLEVVALMKACKGFGELHTHWRSVASYLGIEEHQIEKLSDDFLLGVKIKSLEQLLEKILSLWRGQKGNQAKIEDLCRALEQSQLNDIAQHLSSNFEGNHKAKMRDIKFIFLGNIVTLTDLLSEDSTDECCEEIYEKIRICFPKNNPHDLLKDQLIPPVQPKYYIPRKLLHYLSYELDPKMFSSDSFKDNVFLFKGITKSELAKLNGYKAIHMSGDQLYNVTGRYILMEHDDDFDRIRKQTKAPIHVIRYDAADAGRCFWMKSSGMLHIIRQFLKGVPQTIEEKDLVSKITSLPFPVALSIADSPGMGKTFVLANLAKQIQGLQPKQIVLFIVLQEFVQQISLVESSFSALEAISTYSASDTIAKLVLLNLLKKHTLNLFLDGYDEVMQDKLDLIDSFLKHAQELENVKMVVTTRPHLVNRLENLFGQLTFEVLPFDDQNQIGFLTKYWVAERGAKQSQHLETFARQCLAALETKFSDKEKLIAGIPLQCMMMADVYGDDAKRASNLETIRRDTVATMSFSEMYRRLIDMKFRRVQGLQKRTNYVNAHVHDAIELLFPDWMEDVRPLLEGYDKIDEATLYSIGLLEKSPNARKPRFVHRTFAEYVLAEFIVNNLNVHKECVDLLFGGILGRGATSKHVGEYYENVLYFYRYELNYSVVAYFIEMHLNELSKKNRINNVPSHEVVQPNRKYSSEDVCLAVGACCNNDLEALFDYAASILCQFEISDELREKYFRDLPHVVAEQSCNVSLLEKVLNLTKVKLNADLSFHTDTNQFGNFNSTPLDVAVQLGKYNLVSYLVEQYGDQVSEMQFDLLHACMGASAKNDRTIIEDKLLILDILSTFNRDCVSERQNALSMALLATNADLRLLQRLVEHGADINVCSKYGTILHAAKDPNTFAELLRWVLSLGFKFINYSDHINRTSLMHAIIEFGTIAEDVLKMFSEADADFNAVDKSEDSVLLHALQYSGNLAFIKKLLEYGADINHCNKRNRNALHMIMRSSGSNEDRRQILDMIFENTPGLLEQKDEDDRTPLLRREADVFLLQRLVEHGADINAYSHKHGTVLHTGGNRNTYPDLVRWALSNGFELINHVDKDMKTPIMRWEMLETADTELLKPFHEAGADINAQDKDGDSILFHALQRLDNQDFIKELIKVGADINHQNKVGQTALDKVIDGRSGSTEEKLQMIDLLVGMNRVWFMDQNAPLLQHNIPLILLQRLVDLGANINVYCINKGTILHTAGNKSNYANIVRWAFSKGFNLINHKDWSGRTPLICAIQMLKTLEDDVLSLFKEAGANFNAEDIYGDSVIFHALFSDVYPDFIRKLLALGANVKDHRNCKKENALHKVINIFGDVRSKLQVIDMLVEINRELLMHRDMYKNTPLLINHGELSILQKLVQCGADINAYSRSQGTVLHLKCEQEDYSDIVHWAFSNGFTETNRTDNYKTTPLMNAIRDFATVDDEVLILFQQEGANFNAKDRKGNSILFHALYWSKDINFIKKLLDFGADFSQKNHRKQTALHRIMQTPDKYCSDCVGSIEERLKILDMLIEMNGDWLEARDKDDCTPLLQWNADLKLLQRLVEHGADVNAYSSCCGTVLHRTKDENAYAHLVSWALSKGFNLINHEKRNPLLYAIKRFGILDDQVLKLFHDAGADFNAQDAQGDSVLFYAIDCSESFNFIKRILEYGANVRHKNQKKQTAIHKILRREIYTGFKQAVIDLLIRASNSDLLHQEDSDGCTALFLTGADLGMLKHLMQHGADINRVDSNRGTILHLAHNKIQYANLIRWLLSNGFKLVNQKDRRERTSLMHAIEKFGTLEGEVLNIFKEAGADFEAQDNMGNSVLFYALHHSVDIDFLERLLGYGTNIFHKNHIKQNAAHIVFKGIGNAEQKMSLNNFLKAKGFTQFNEADSMGQTPWMLLCHRRDIEWSGIQNKFKTKTKAFWKKKS